MIDYEYDDGGRAEAGYKGTTGDCAVRALAIATGRSYKECYRALADAHKKSHGRRTARDGISGKDFDKIATQFGMTKVSIGTGVKPTMTQVADLVKGAPCVVSVTKHFAAIVDGALRDAFDCRTYDWLNADGTAFEKRERKVFSVWIAQSS